MNAVWQIVQQGGPVMAPLIVLSLVLYERCFRLLFFLLRTRRRISRNSTYSLEDLMQLRASQAGLHEMFAREIAVIGALVAAAPLLGLLGTVMGMINAFDTMSGASGPKSGDGLAGGISMALITTETGLAIAIPAVVVIYYAQRQLQRIVHALVQLEDGVTSST